MGNYFICPFCNISNPVIKETAKARVINFSGCQFYDHKGLDSMGTPYASLYHGDREGTFLLIFLKCTKCNRTHITAKGLSHDLADQKINLSPRFSCKNFPEYIPASIREDYEEACEIQNISPKAAATLARRCMQGIIRDFWKVDGTNLYQEIDLIRDKVDPDIWTSLDGLRKIGNIGAHMEKDINLIVEIEPGEVSSLLQFIELLIDEWYVNRHNRQKLLSAIPLINEKKQEERQIVPEDSLPL